MRQIHLCCCLPCFLRQFERNGRSNGGFHAANCNENRFCSTRWFTIVINEMAHPKHIYPHSNRNSYKIGWTKPIRIHFGFAKNARFPWKVSFCAIYPPPIADDLDEARAEKYEEVQKPTQTDCNRSNLLRRQSINNYFNLLPKEQWLQ